jgi:hypothetical protein
VIAGEGPHNINDHGSTTVDGLINQLANTFATPGNNNTYMRGDSYVFLGPEHARQFSNGGMSREDVQARLFEASRVPRDRFSPEQLEYLDAGYGPDQKAISSQAIYLGVSWRDLKVVVVGGDGRHSCWVPTFGINMSCSEVI